MAVQTMASDRRLGRAVPETNQALGRVAAPSEASEQAAALPSPAQRGVATRYLTGQESAEVIVGPRRLKDRTSQPHGGAVQTSTVPLNPTGGGDIGGQCVISHDLYCGEPPTARPAWWVLWGRGENPGYRFSAHCGTRQYRGLAAIRTADPRGPRNWGSKYSSCHERLHHLALLSRLSLRNVQLVPLPRRAESAPR